MEGLSKVDKGTVVERKVATELMERGYHISEPLSHDCRYDLVVDRGDYLERVQVKTALMRNGGIDFNVSSGGRNGGNPYTVDEIDSFIVGHPDMDSFFYMPIEEVDTDHAVRLNMRNIDSSQSRFAGDYFLEDELQ